MPMAPVLKLPPGLLHSVSFSSFSAAITEYHRPHITCGEAHWFPAKSNNMVPASSLSDGGLLVTSWPGRGGCKPVNSSLSSASWKAANVTMRPGPHGFILSDSSIANDHASGSLVSLLNHEASSSLILGFSTAVEKSL